MDLIIETALRDIRIAVVENEKLIAEKLVENGRGEVLDSLTTELFSEANISLSDVKRVLVTQGPGSFTGLRTGMAFAQGLSYTRKRKLYGVSTLAALSTLAPVNSNVMVVIKAKPGYYYVGSGRIPDNCVNLSREALIEEYQLAEWAQKADVLIADFKATPLEGIKSEFSQTISLEDGFSLESMSKLFECLPTLSVAKPNYLQKSYAEQTHS